MNTEKFSWEEKTFNGERLHIIGTDKFTVKPTLLVKNQIEESFSLDIKKGDAKINIFVDKLVVNRKNKFQYRYLIEKNNIEAINIVSAKNEKKNVRSGAITINLKEAIGQKEFYGGKETVSLKFAQTPDNINVLYDILDENGIVVSMI